MFRAKRKTLVDGAEKLIRKTGWSDKNICTIMRTIHFCVPMLTGYILFFGTKFWFSVVILINICIFLLFYIFGGCILSSLEHRFTADDFTVIDPLLLVLGVELTKENRDKYTLWSNIFTCMFMVILYYVRFVYKKPAMNLNKGHLGEETTHL